MLLEIPKANFHPEAARRKTARYHQKLLNHPLEIAMQPREVEIIPFEQLWHIIIHYLRSPKRKSCLLYTSPSPRDRTRSRMPSSA